ncbi:3-dehydroquinate synthase [Bacillus massiliigorillae]|uniref:3-dehydroquinate synthase n=1 Tax=Bacillus massiliigorillae TaxID=1243664 RepID=UPI0003A477D8|nr:3-dehydroquinate synthase [Bacillus massiliigorillae]
MNQLTIETSSKTYPVVIGSDILKELPAFINTNLQPLSKIWIISDATVAPLYLAKLQDILAPHFKDIIVSVVPSGESAKSFSVFEQCHRDGLEGNVNRKSVILALGGGAVGDLAGFVAATFMRGIRFIGIPTTLLAHDSAVGGKVAINHPLGKNMVGAFHQPEAVFYDWSLLQSLPEKELRSGFAEAIKHGLIQDVDFYNWMHTTINSLQDLSGDILAKVITKGIGVKASVVKQDERELGVREYLNFGHTLAHSIEANIGYGKTTHGEAVLIGMIFALKMSMEKVNLEFDIDSFIAWVKKLGYSTELPALDHADLLHSMKKDKKTTSSNIKFVLLNHIGEPTTMQLEDEEVLDCLQRYFA